MTLSFAEEIEILSKKIKKHLKAARSRYYKITLKHNRIVEELYKQLSEVVDELIDYARVCGWIVQKSNNEFYQDYIGGAGKLLEYTVSKNTRSMTVYGDKSGFICIGVAHLDVRDDYDDVLLTGLDNKHAFKYLEVY